MDQNWPTSEPTRVEPPRPVTSNTPPAEYGSLPDEFLHWSAAFGVVAPTATIFAKAFLESLGERAADGVAGLPSRLRQRWFRREATSGPAELAAVLDVDNGGTAAILVTADLPDEARLALLDLDATDPSVQGKILGWSAELQQWTSVTAPTEQVTPPDHYND